MRYSLGLSLGLMLLSFNASAQNREAQSMQERLSRVLSRDVSISKEIQRLQESLARMEADRDGLHQDQERLAKEIEEKDARLEELMRLTQAKRSGIAILLRHHYRVRPPALSLDLSPRGHQAELESQTYTRYWHAHYQRELSRYAAEAMNLSQERQVLAALMQNQAEVEHRLRQRQKKLREERQELEQLWQMVRSQKEYYSKLLAELEQSSLRMDEVMRQWQSQSGVTTRFGQMKGRLLYPVKGRIEKRYGPYRDMTVGTVRHHKGIDIRAPKLSPVRAIFDGRVVFAQWFEGYGQTVIIDHEGGYFSLYAHLHEVSKKGGDPIVIGDIIGTVGDTASLKGPYLYFELREKGISQDPLPWLVKK